MSLPPFAFPIRVPADVLEALGKFTGNFWSDSLSLEPYVVEALRNYMDPPPPAPHQQPAPQSEAGYQWKEVFLPEGTRLRANFDRQPYFATVEGAEIRYGKHSVSPSCFANLQGSGNRNAWKAIWLRLPGSDEWLLADVCRSARKAAIARLLTGEAKPDNQQSRAPALPQPDQTTQPPQRRTASGVPDVERPRVASQPAARHADIRPRGATATAHGNDTQHKNGTGRAARRRKRRAKKPAAGQP